VIETAVKGARNARNAALGINDRTTDLFGFARKTDSHWYGEWVDVGLSDVEPSFIYGDWETAFTQAMDRSGKIHFNLDGIIGDPVEFARLGSMSGPGSGGTPITAWELNQIRNNADWLSKTIFYRNGQVVSSPFGP
jgi:hypothetical protein